MGCGVYILCGIKIGNEISRTELERQIGTESQSGIPDVPVSGNAQRGSTSQISRAGKPRIRSSGIRTDKDVLDNESTAGNSVQAPEVSTPTVGMEGQPTAGGTGQDIQGDRSNQVVSVPSGRDDKSTSGPSLDENYDLRNAEPVRLTKG